MYYRQFSMEKKIIGKIPLGVEGFFLFNLSCKILIFFNFTITKKSLTSQLNEPTNKFKKSPQVVKQTNKKPLL